METYSTCFLFLLIVLVFPTNGELVGDCTIKPHLNCTLYKFTGIDCALPRLLERFPEIYNFTSDFPGTPATFKADLPYDDKYPQYIRCKLSFTPMQNVGIRYVKGFEISFVRSDRTEPTCYVFDMSKAQWKGDLEDKLTVFTKDIGILAPKKIYHIELYALPKPYPPQLDDYKYLDIDVPPIPDDPDVAQKWRASISYKVYDAQRSVLMAFYPPPAKFNFTQFDIDLWMVPGNKPWGMQRISDTFFNFTNVSPGNHTIRVTPYDPYYRTMDPQKCLCVLNNFCEHCSTTVTAQFELKDVPTPPPPTTTPAPTTTPVTQAARQTTDGNSVAGVKVGLAVIGTVIGVALVVVVVYLYWCRCRNGGGDYEVDKDGTDNKGLDTESVITIDVIKRKNNIDANKRRFSRKLKLFLLYEEDHPCHRKVVDNFAKYLQQYAQCDVMCAEWHLDQPWIQEQIKTADHIVIVNSAKAYISYMNQFAVKDGSGLGNGRRGSASISSIRNKFLQEQQYQTIVMVYFDYTDEQYVIPDICPGYKYKLMKNFTEFLRHIHKIPETERLSQFDLPVDGNHNLRPAGHDLVMAITEAREYERNQPRHVLTMQRTISKVSEPDSQIDSGLPEDMESPEPRFSSGEPRWRSETERRLLEYLDSTSQGAVTVYPQGNIIPEIQAINPAPIAQAPMPHPPVQSQQQAPVVLSPLKINSPITEPSFFTPSPPTADSEHCEFDFLPPDDLSDFDAVSKTQSEQMRCINDRYQAFRTVDTSAAPQTTLQRGNQSDRKEEMAERQSGGYDKNTDLYLLNMNNGDGLIPGMETEDSVSLGGQSV